MADIKRYQEAHYLEYKGDTPYYNTDLDQAIKMPLVPEDRALKCMDMDEEAGFIVIMEKKIYPESFHPSKVSSILYYTHIDRDQFNIEVESINKDIFELNISGYDLVKYYKYWELDIPKDLEKYKKDCRGTVNV